MKDERSWIFGEVNIWKLDLASVLVSRGTGTWAKGQVQGSTVLTVPVSALGGTDAFSWVIQPTRNQTG